MNILQNQLNQNWRNYTPDINIQNPIDKKLSAKGKKRIGVIPNNLNSGRQMTFLTQRRNSNFSYFSNIAQFGFDDVARKDIERYQRKLNDPKSSPRQKADAQKQIEYLESRLQARQARNTNQSQSTSDTNASLPKERVKQNSGTKKPDRYGFNKQEADSLINELRQTEFDSFVAKANDKAKGTSEDFVSKVNKVDEKVARKIPNKTLGAIAATAGAGLTINEVRKKMKKDREAKYSFMDNIIEL